MNSIIGRDRVIHFYFKITNKDTIEAADAMYAHSQSKPIKFLQNAERSILPLFFYIRGESKSNERATKKYAKCDENRK